MDKQDKNGPLDGSTSGTIGGGGAEAGGASDRPEAQGSQKGKPENAASGRLAPEALPVPAEPDPPGQGATDVSAVRDGISSARD